MRRPVSLAAALALAVAVVLPPTATASPSDVYQDFVANGGLRCTHSQADLKAVISSAGLNQYSDQATMTDLRIAVQRALASGCYSARSGSPGGSAAADAGLVSSVGVFVLVGAGALLALGAAGIVIRRTLDPKR